MALQRIRKISLGIVQDPEINSGRPIIEGTRIFVDRIIGHLESGMPLAEIYNDKSSTILLHHNIQKHHPILN